MPNNPNARKTVRKDEKRRLHNRSIRSTLKTLIKKARDAAVGSDPAAAETAFREVTKRLDQAASKNLLHANKAGRLKSRLSHLIKSRSGAAPAPEAAKS